MEGMNESRPEQAGAARELISLIWNVSGSGATLSLLVIVATARNSLAPLAMEDEFTGAGRGAVFQLSLITGLYVQSDYRRGLAYSRAERRSSRRISEQVFD